MNIKRVIILIVIILSVLYRCDSLLLSVIEVKLKLM